MTEYRSIRELAAKEPPGRSFCIEWRKGRSGLVIMAIHGGGIEPGTTEIAEAAAGKDHGFYSFTGLKKSGNRALHIPSHLFDESIGRNMAASARTVAAVHGCRGQTPITYLGGKDEALKNAVGKELAASGFRAAESPRLPGLLPDNICNRGRSAKGLQLELSRGLRQLLFAELCSSGRSRTGPSFARFVSALRKGLEVL